MQPYATDAVSLGSAEEPYAPDMTHSYRLTEGRLIRYPLIKVESVVTQWPPLARVRKVTSVAFHVRMERPKFWQSHLDR